jgi:polysaccharide export outer membrane protein
MRNSKYLHRLLRNCLALGVLAFFAAGPRLQAQAPVQAQPLAETQAVPRAQAVSPSQQIAAVPSQPVAEGAVVPLRSGDTVDIRIANVPPEDQGQWDASYTVDESGSLNLPFIGMVKVGGAPPSQVQIEIQNKLIADGIYTNPTVTVTPPAGMRFISMGGAVRQPGRIPYTSDLTLMSAISAAGGASDFAGDTIRLIRGGKIQKYSRKKLDKDPSKDPRIEPGDQIEIKESMW